MQQNPFAETTESASPTVEELVRQAKDGSQEALELLIRRHQPWVYNVVLRMIYHPQGAEDVTQKILIRLLTKLSTFEGRSRFRTWLYGIDATTISSRRGGAKSSEPSPTSDR